MPIFDLDAARKAGYSDDEIVDGLAKQHGVDIGAARKAGYSTSDMLPGLIAQAGKPSRSLLEDIPIGFMSTAGKVLGAWDKGAVALSDALPDWMPGKMSEEDRATYAARGKNFQEFANEHPAERWTGQVTSGLTYAPFLGAAPVVAGGSEGTARSQLLQSQGVDAATANKAGAFEGALQAGIQMLPLGKYAFGEGTKALGKSIVASTVKAGAAGGAQSVVSDLETQQLLSNAGYDKQAENYAPSVDKAIDSAIFNASFHGGSQAAHRIVNGNPVHNEIAAAIDSVNIDRANQFGPEWTPAAQAVARLNPNRGDEVLVDPSETVKQHVALNEIATATDVDSAIDAANRSVQATSGDDAVVKMLHAIRPMTEITEPLPDAPVATETQTAPPVEELPQAKKVQSRGDAMRAALDSKDPFLGFLARNGVSALDRSDTGVEPGARGNRMVPGYGPVFRKNGLRLDELALKAVEDGHLTQADIDNPSDVGGTNKIAEMIQRAVASKEIIGSGEHVEPTMSHSDAALMDEAQRLGVNTDGMSIDRVYDEVKAHHDAAEKMADDHAPLATEDELWAEYERIQHAEQEQAAARSTNSIQPVTGSPADRGGIVNSEEGNAQSRNRPVEAKKSEGRLGGYQESNEEGNYAVEQRSKGYRDDRTADLFDVPDDQRATVVRRSLSNGPDAEPAATAIMRSTSLPGEYATVVENRLGKTEKVGIDHVHSAADAAHVTSSLTDLAREHFDVLVLGDQGKVIAVQRMFAGGKTSTSVLPAEVIAFVNSIPGAQSFYASHNHPGGSHVFSDADMSMTANMRRLSDGITPQFMGLLALSHDNFSHTSDGIATDAQGPTPTPPRDKTIQYVEQTFTKSDKLGPPISSPSVARSIVSNIAKGRTGIVLTDVRNQPVGFFPLDFSTAGALKNTITARDVMAAVAKTNASGAFLATGANAEHSTVANVGTLLARADVRVNDAFNEESLGDRSVQSSAESGIGMTNPGDVLHSKSMGAVENPSSVDAIRPAMNVALGRYGNNFTEQLESTGKFKVIDSSQAAEVLGKDAEGPAFFDPKTGTTYLVADKISKDASQDDLHGLVLHEIANHALQMGRTSSEFSGLLDRVELMARSGNVDAKAAYDRADQAGATKETRNEEALGYLLEANPNLSLSQRAVAWMRQGVRSIGNALPVLQRSEWFKSVDAMSVQDLTYAAQKVLQGSPSDLVNAPIRDGQAVAFSKAALGSSDSEAKAPYSGPGAKLMETTKNWLSSVTDDVLMKSAPMSLGTDQSRAIAKDYANAERKARWEWSRMDTVLKREYSEEQRESMWNAADEENLIRSRGESSDGTGKGLDSLPPDQRHTMDALHHYGEELMNRARAVGMFEGGGVPYWAPRMAVMVGADGEYAKPPSGEQGASGASTGRNITTTASSLKQRKYLTSEETEAAMKAKLGDNAQLVRDIRTMPMAMARLERAIAGRELVNQIRELGKTTGRDTVSSSDGPDFFTIDHPAFKTFRPRMIESDGKMVPAEDQNGDMIFDRTPLYISKEFEGPLKAIMSNDSGTLYQAYMTLKAKTMGVIMYSPLIHNAVEWGRALPIMPGKVLTFSIYFEGNKIKNDATQMRQAISDGLVPIGHRGGTQDITGIMEDPDLIPGRSWTSKIIGGALDHTVGEKAGTAAKKGIDAAGDFWHNTLLWDRIGDLQAGIYGNVKSDMMKKGMDEQTAGRLAAHFANRYAGALPNEAMSVNSRKIANFVLFSRSFTLGNIGVMKDMITGLPKDVQSQIKMDIGELGLKAANSVARRKAMMAFGLDIALLYAGNSLLQDALDYLKRDKSMSDIEQGYVDRFSKLMGKVKENPMTLLNPLSNVQSLTSNSENEPGKEKRIHFGTDDGGTSTYLRLPTGKIGEEFEGWLTSPLDTLLRKQGTVMRPITQTIENDKGFGRRVYDPNAEGMGGAAKNIGRIVWNLMSQQLPMDSATAAHDWMTGHADDTDKLKAVGPLFGMTFSKGAPGGPAVGEMYASDRRHMGEVADIMPDVHRQIKLGNEDAARDLMDSVGMTPKEIAALLRKDENPGSRLSKNGMKRFNLHASDEEKEKMDQLRQ